MIILFSAVKDIDDRVSLHIQAFYRERFVNKEISELMFHFTLISVNSLMLYFMIPFYEVKIKTSSINYKVYLKNPSSIDCVL